MEAARYSSWQEVVVSNGKGRRVVHYYVKGAGGRADLAVVGREKSSRHMSYVVPNQFVRSLITRPYFLQPSPSSSSSLNSPPEAVSFKWRSRREVIDWLSSLVSDPIGNLSSSADRFGFCEDYETEDMLNSKFSSEKTKHPSREFQWLGAPWLCRKRKSHYRSFCKNGVTILVHDFVFVMVEENKRRVAYVDDLYEDSRSNNMVVISVLNASMGWLQSSALSILNNFRMRQGTPVGGELLFPPLLTPHPLFLPLSLLSK